MNHFRCVVADYHSGNAIKRTDLIYSHRDLKCVVVYYNSGNRMKERTEENTCQELNCHSVTRVLFLKKY